MAQALVTLWAPSTLTAWLRLPHGQLSGPLSDCDTSPHLAHSVCRGRQWHCTGHRCSGRCQASGAPHYVTFDGLALTFPGACEYLLVREASGRFSISARNLPCGTSGLTCTKSLTVRLESIIVHLLRGGCTTCRGGRCSRAPHVAHFWLLTGPGCPHRCGGQGPALTVGPCSSAKTLGAAESNSLPGLRGQRGPRKLGEEARPFLNASPPPPQAGQ